MPTGEAAIDRARKIDRGYALDFPDGALEFVHSGSVGGPDQVGGLHYGTTYLYFRLIRPDGRTGAWRRPLARSWAKAVEAAGRYGSAVAAYAALIDEPDDLIGPPASPPPP